MTNFSPFYCYAECCYAEFRRAKCHVAKCLYSESYFCRLPLGCILFFTECHYDLMLNVVMMSVVILKDFMLNSLQ